MGDSNKKKVLYDSDTRVAPLGLVSLKGTGELSTKINNYLSSWSKESGENTESFLIPNECPRFQSGDGKGIIHETVRGKDIFIIIDVGNYNCTYKLFGRNNCMSPDDHYQDLKRIIQAISGKAHRINVIMPMLYGGRQHRRTYRESLDCAYALQELQSMGVSNLLTVDAHDFRVSNAIPLMGFDNIIPSYQMLKKLFKSFPNLDLKNFMVISPDAGALHRNEYYASVLEVELGMFVKRRDYSKIVDGKNQIIAHDYLGGSVEGKDILVADDIIASGGSILDLIKQLRRRGANKIFTYVTYPLFTEGLEKFDEEYAKGNLTAVLGTNLSYTTPELRSRPWYYEVDVSKYIAYFISALNHDISIGEIIAPYNKIKEMLRGKTSCDN